MNPANAPNLSDYGIPEPILNKYGAYQHDHPVITGLHDAERAYNQSVRSLVAAYDPDPIELRALQAYAVGNLVGLFAELSLRKATQMHKAEKGDTTPLPPHASP